MTGETRPRAAISWSGGKDSCAALLRARTEYDVCCTVTMFDEEAARSRSHGLRPDLVRAQAERLGMTAHIARCSWTSYTAAFREMLRAVAADGIGHVVFGDILFDEHRRWAEDVCAAEGLTAIEPLWGLPTDQLFEEWVASGSRAVIVTARAAHLDRTWLGRTLARDMLPEFARLGVDPCGERGEYHTAVVDAPVFSAPLAVRPGQQVLRSGCWALDLECEGAGRA